MKKRLIAALMASLLTFTVIPPTVMAEDTTTEGESENACISGFGGFEWGSPMEDALASLEADGLDLSKDVVIQEDEDNPGYGGFLIADSEVGGYKSSAAFLYKDNEFVYGAYTSLDLRDPDVFSDILAKITSVYGEPYYHVKDKGIFKDCVIWVDNEKNCIWLSHMLGFGYLSGESTFIDDFDYDDIFQEWYGFSILDKLEQYNNTDGI